MAYQNVGTPRFYIDYFSYWQSIGLIEAVVENQYGAGTISGNPLGLDPLTPFTISGAPDTNGNFMVAVDLKDNIDQRALESINYMGYFGHTFGALYGDATATAIRMNFVKKTSGAVGHWGTSEWRGACTQQNVLDENGNNIAAGDAEIINAEHISIPGGLDNYTSFDNSGFSLHKVNANENSSDDHLETDVDRFYLTFKQYNSSGVIDQTDYSDINPLWNLNCLTMGHFYDMPVSPDLDVKMKIDFDGYDTAETIGGSTLTNIRYEGNPKWGNNNAWEIGESNPYYRRRGRRSWNLKFSYISDEDIFSSNYSSNTYLQDGLDSSNDAYNDNDDLNSDRDAFEYTLADDDSFVAKVLNFVGNGQRFIFQPDSNNNNPDQFAICMLDQDSLQITQKAFKVYNINLKIVEVW